MNALDPNQMSAAERITEIAEILAAGLMRLRAQKLPTAEKVRSTSPATRAVLPTPVLLRSNMKNSVLARISALKAMAMPDLKQQWRDLFETEPPPYNRRFLEHRLAYRIQELAYGGLKPETVNRLKAIAEDLDGGDPARRRQAAKDRPIAGRRLIREWQGIEHCVTVRDEGFEYRGRPFQSLSAIARAITGTRWNGWVFFGLKNQRAR